MAEQARSIQDVQAQAYKAYVQAMKDGMANLDVEAIDIPAGGAATPGLLPSCHCVGTFYCMGHVGCAGGCVGCFGSVGTFACYAQSTGTSS